MDPFNFADALLGVLSQRLVRRLCTHCRAKQEPSVRDMEALAAEYCLDTPLEAEEVLKRWRAQKPSLYLPKGCEKCDRSGYSGRVAVYELMVADALVKRLIQKRALVSEIVAAALANGMHTLKQDAIEKVLAGHTDMSQARAI
jgi:type II secretory ATPase GspE/PulE/Tfp pilus assembly ATPase PilB-like protein